MGRAETERALETAAIAELRERGVLAGLNLQAVADLAAVNRGNVYHYFGSGRMLLRSALKRRRTMNAAVVTGQKYDSIRDWMRWSFRFMIEQLESIRVTALLILDGDQDAELMAFRDDQETKLRELQGQHQLDSDVDPTMMLVFMNAVTRGYALHRDHFAQQLGLSAGELDDRMEAFLLRLMDALSTSDQQ